MRALLPIDRRVIAWFVAGLLMAAFLQVVQARALGGGADALLSVGAESQLRPIIEAQLGTVTTTSGVGHDGQTAFVVAVDPLGRGPGPDALDHAGFRYRRILYPLIAGGFGALSADATVVGLAIAGALGFGLAVASVADLALTHGASDRLALAALLAPGLWLSVRLSTVDALALGFMFFALALWARGATTLATAALVASALTKEQMLVTAIALGAHALWIRRPALAALTWCVPAAALAVWSGVVSALVGDGFAARGNLALPFAGIVDASRTWPATPASDRVLIAVTLLSMIVGAVAAWLERSSPLAWVAAAWAALALVGSSWVWDFGNNAARVYAALIPLAALLLAGRFMSARAKARPVHA